MAGTSEARSWIHVPIEATSFRVWANGNAVTTLSGTDRDAAITAAREYEALFPELSVSLSYFLDGGESFAYPLNQLRP